MARGKKEKKEEPAKIETPEPSVVRLGPRSELRIELKIGRGGSKSVSISRWIEILDRVSGEPVWIPKSGIWIPVEDDIPERVAAHLLTLADPNIELQAVILGAPNGD